MGYVFAFLTQPLISALTFRSTAHMIAESRFAMEVAWMTNTRKMKENRNRIYPPRTFHKACHGAS